jgi:hypothetical protein
VRPLGVLTVRTPSEDRSYCQPGAWCFPR